MFALRTRLLTSAVAFRALAVPQNLARINTSSTTSFVRFQSASTLMFNERLFSTATPAQPESDKDQQQTSANAASETPKVQDKVAVPKDLVKFIIGPKGAILKHLCERSGGASLTFTKEFNEQNEEIAAITGDEKQVASLKQLVAEEIERAKAKAAAAATQGTEGAPKKPRRDSNSRENGASSYAEEVIVDSYYVGSLIGKQGIVLKDMERVSGARISYSDREAESKERTARISGSPQQVQAAKNLISQKVNEIAQQFREKRNAEDAGESRQRGDRRPRGPRQPQANDVKQVVEVPTECVGYLIGRGGRGLFNIQDQTQTKIDFARQDHREGAREVTIYGSEDSVQKACDLIQQRVKESLEKAKQPSN